VKKAVEEAWIGRVIRDAEQNRDGKLRWDCTREPFMGDDLLILFVYGSKMVTRLQDLIN